MWKPRVHQVFDGGHLCWHVTGEGKCHATWREAFAAARRAAARFAGREVPC